MTALQPFANLIFLTAALVLPVLARLFSKAIDARILGRVGLTLFLIMTSSAHFTNAQVMVVMLPPFVPQPLLLIYATGVLELLLAGLLWVPGWSKKAGLAIVIMLLAFLPANIYTAWNSLPFGGHALGPSYLLVRIPYQALVVVWALWATGWIGGKRNAG